MRKKLKKRRTFIFLAMVSFVFLSTLFVFSQEKRPFAPEDILNLKRLSDPQISPTGDWIAFVVTQFEENRKMNSEVWIVSKDGKTLKQITENPGPDRTPRWSPEGDTLAFLSKRDKDEYTQIYAYSLKDEGMERVTDEQSSVRNLKWSPDNKKIAFLMTDPLTKEEAQRHKRGDDAYVVDQDEKHTRLWILDIESRSSRPLTPRDMTVWQFNWSPDNKKIAVLASPISTAEGMEYQSHLGVVDVQSGKEVVLTRKTNAQASPSFSPDGKWIVYLGPVGRFKERGIIKVISVEGGEPIELLKEYKGNVWDVIWHPREKKLLVALAKRSNNHLVSLNLKEEILFHVQMDHSIIPYWGNYWSVSADGEYVAFLSERLDSAKEIWISALDGKGKRQLTNFNNYLKEVKLGKVEVIKWVNPRDNSEVEGILVKPVNFDPKKRFPLIVWFHGGPAYNWSLGIQVNNWAQLFASQDYMIFLPNFRGSSGYGMKWMMANVENWGGGPMGDVMSGVDYLINQGWVDKDRLFVGGGSYGGYLTSWLITQTTRFKAAYVAAGVTDLVTEYALTDEPSFLIGYFNSTPYDNEEIYRKNSPLSYASQVKIPVLIIHGERDLRVPISQAYEFYSALKHYGAKAKLVIYPREYHGIREYVHQLDLMNRVLEWFKEHGSN
jgi:dipeptidyl aminopeptidase/acylaminoacyl peptidase